MYLNKPDICNALFEFCGALFQLMNVKALIKDRQIQGVSVMPSIFFFGWGLYNLYYYRHLGQWYSLLGSMSLTFVNLIWLVLAALIILPGFVQDVDG